MLHIKEMQKKKKKKSLPQKDVLTAGAETFEAELISFLGMRSSQEMLHNAVSYGMFQRYSKG